MIYSEKEYNKAYQTIKKILLNQKNKENYPLATLVGGNLEAEKVSFQNMF